MKSWTGFLRRKRITLPSVGLLLGGVGVGALFWFQPRFLVRKVAQHNRDVLFYVDTDRMVLALTLDDAPDSVLTPQLLDLLAAQDIRVTFFVLGDHVPGNEDLIARMKAGGHELGNHLVHDEPSINLTNEEFARQLGAVEKMIGPLGETKWCGPGSGWFTPAMLKTAHEMGYSCCLGSIYPLDNKVRHPDLIRRAVMDRIHPGAVLVLHEGGPKRAYILPLLEELIPELKAAGYEFLTLSEIARLEER